MFELEEYALIQLCDEWLSQESKRIKWDYNLGSDFINSMWYLHLRLIKLTRVDETWLSTWERKLIGARQRT